MRLCSRDAAITDIFLFKTLGNLEALKARPGTVRTIMLPEVSIKVSQSHYNIFTRLSASYDSLLKVKTKTVTTLKVKNKVQERASES